MKFLEWQDMQSTSNFTCFVSGEKNLHSFGLLGEMNRRGIVGGCIYEFQRPVVDSKACF